MDNDDYQRMDIQIKYSSNNYQIRWKHFEELIDKTQRLLFREKYHMTDDEVTKYKDEGRLYYQSSYDFDPKEIEKVRIDTRIKDIEEYVKRITSACTIRNDSAVSNRHTIRIVRNIYEVINDIFFDGKLPPKFCVKIRYDNTRKSSKWITDEGNKRFFLISVAKYIYKYEDNIEYSRWIEGIIIEIISGILGYINQRVIENIIPVYFEHKCKMCHKKNIFRSERNRCVSCNRSETCDIYKVYPFYTERRKKGKRRRKNSSSRKKPY